MNTWLRLSTLLLLLHGLWPAAKADHPEEVGLDTVGAEFKAACVARLQALAEALQAWEQERGEPPLWLSDLVEAGYLDDPDDLRCPVTVHTGETPFNNLYFEDPRVAGSYMYEFCPVPIVPGGEVGQEVTMRSWKLRQRRIVGDRVPMVRCPFHGEVLNIGAGYEIFESALAWEDQITDPLLRQAIGIIPMGDSNRPLAGWVGEQIDAFSLPSARAPGEHLRYEAPSEAPQVIVFFSLDFAPSTWLLDALATAVGPAEARFWGVAVNSEAEGVAQRASRLPAAAHVGLDPDNNLAARFGATDIPHVVVIDTDGVLRYVERGLDSGTLSRVLEQLRAVRGKGSTAD